MTDARLKGVEALRVVDRVIAGLAHDLNNPLAGILGYCHLLRTERDPARVREYARHVQSQAERCRDMVGDLQELVVRSPLRERELPARDLVDGALLFHRGAIDAAGVEVKVTISGAPVVHGDHDQLRRALGKLIDNALDAMGRGNGEPRLTLSVRAEGESVVFEVADTGPGFPLHVRENAFDLTVTTRKSGNGIGLGLAAALSIALRHEGDVRILDYGPPGARVALVLPRYTAAAVPEPEPAASRPPILCIDDQDFIRDLYEDVADFLGVTAHTAATAAEAEEILKSLRPELVICDYNLPAMTAVELYLRVSERHPRLKGRFAVCTGTPDDPEVVRQCRQLGLRLVAKPFTVIDLKSLITDLGSISP